MNGPVVRERFLADHGELEALFTRLLAAFETEDPDAIASRWSEFDARLSKHLEVEERFMIPRLSSSRPRDARAILEEHRHIRSRLVEFGFKVDLRVVRPETARGFVEELRAHARHEDDVLYRWADEEGAAPGSEPDQVTEGSKVSSAETSSSTFTGLVR